jgi:hypothetical protein
MIPRVAYIFQSMNSSIIITIRDKRVGERLINREQSLVVLTLISTEAESMLQSKLPENLWNEINSREFFRILDFLLFAIS